MSSPDAASQIGTLIGDWWWLIFFLPLGGAEEGVRRYRNRREERAQLKHERELEKLQILERMRQHAIEGQYPTPGPCVHRNSVPVVETDEYELNGKVVAWYCKSCDTQLPANWAIRKEDL